MIEINDSTAIGNILLAVAKQGITEVSIDDIHEYEDKIAKLLMNSPCYERPDGECYTVGWSTRGIIDFTYTYEFLCKLDGMKIIFKFEEDGTPSFSKMEHYFRYNAPNALLDAIRDTIKAEGANAELQTDLKNRGNSIMPITIRAASDSDYEQIKDLFRICFGGIAESFGALSPIKGRYFVAEADHKIVAISGILPLARSDYHGYEITWTCSHPNFRRRGLVVDILRLCEHFLPNDHLPLYCSCWRVKDNADINMKFVMQKLGMHLVFQNRLNRMYIHNKECSDCHYSEDSCHCCEDLYMKER